MLNKSLIQNINNKIEFKNVSFAFDGKKNILKDFSFDFNKNQKIGLSGISGSGKTTLTDILTGLIKPSNGKILCDEIDINRDIYGWQNQIAYVPQNVILIDDTIENNICFEEKKEKIDQQRLEQIIKISKLDDFIKELPEGLDTNIGVLASKVSGGQKQRIGLARALYLNRPFLILDEATNSLDKKTEDEIINNLINMPDLTLLLVSHNISIINKCEKIIKI